MRVADAGAVVVGRAPDPAGRATPWWCRPITSTGSPQPSSAAATEPADVPTATRAVARVETGLGLDGRERAEQPGEAEHAAAAEHQRTNRLAVGVAAYPPPAPGGVGPGHARGPRRRRRPRPAVSMSVGRPAARRSVSAAVISFVTATCADPRERPTAATMTVVVDDYFVAETFGLDAWPGGAEGSRADGDVEETAQVRMNRRVGPMIVPGAWARLRA